MVCGNDLKRCRNQNVSESRECDSFLIPAPHLEGYSLGATLEEAMGFRSDGFELFRSRGGFLAGHCRICLVLDITGEFYLWASLACGLCTECACYDEAGEECDLFYLVHCITFFDFVIICIEITVGFPSWCRLDECVQ